MANSPEVREFPSREVMANSLSELIADKLNKQAAHLAVSGGSSPKALYESLAASDLNWSDIAVTLVDERWVPIGHPRSNEAFIRKAFEKAEGAPITGLFTGDDAPGDGVAAINEKLRALPPLDVVVLGMGGDGHTASWFPHAEGLSAALESDDPVCAVRAKQSEVTGEEVDRITMTLEAIKSAPLVILMIAGDDKRAALIAALEEGPIEDMPVRAILRTRPDLMICWAP